MKKFRESVSMTLEEAASLCGISQDYLFKMESGKRRVPGPALLKRLADNYGHLVDHFYREHPPSPDLSRVPAFVVRQVAKNADPALAARVLAAVEEANREHAQHLAKKKDRR